MQLVEDAQIQIHVPEQCNQSVWMQIGTRSQSAKPNNVYSMHKFFLITDKLSSI